MLLHAGSTSEIMQRFEMYGLPAHAKAVFGGYLQNSVLLNEWLSKRCDVEKRGRQEEEQEEDVDEEER